MAQSTSTLLRLHIDHPRWPLTVLIWLVMIVVTLLTIACFAIIVLWRAQLTPYYANWRWGNLYVEYTVFIPVGVSLSTGHFDEG